MNDNKFRYEPLSENELQRLWMKHKCIIETFITNNKYDVNDIYVDEDTVMSIIVKVHQRRKYFEYYHGLNMSECKEVALICFWYVKLRPICAVAKEVAEQSQRGLNTINEKLAVYYMIVTLRGMLEEEKISTQQLDDISESYLQELTYSLRYRDLSKEGLILLVETIAVFLGLDPYNSRNNHNNTDQAVGK